jgi:cyanophycin synthetase
MKKRGLVIDSLRLLYGANYFSWEPVVWMRLDLGPYDEVFSNEIKGFPAALKAALPSLYDHHCSPGVPGGFLQRVEEGTLMGHIIEHVAIELQQLAGISVNFGKTRATETQGVYNVLFEFVDEKAGLFAARAAVDLVGSLLAGRPYPVTEAVAELLRIREDRLLGPSTQALVDAAERRAIPWMRLDDKNLVQLGTGRFQRRIRATLTSRTGLIAFETALDKFLSLSLLADAAIPVPEQICSLDDETLLTFFRKLGTPVTVKPRQGALGKGVTNGITDENSLARAIAAARAVHDEVLVQVTAPGHGFRLLVLDGELVAAARLDPAFVTGDGSSSIASLVETLNRDPRRAVGDKGTLSLAQFDETSQRILAASGLNQDSVLPAGKTCMLQVSGSMKLGGMAHDVTDHVHPETKLLVERAARIVGLDAAGIDIVAVDIAEPLGPQKGVVIEIGAAPDFRPHLSPTEGKRHEVAERMIAGLFPPGEPDHALIISVAGGAGASEAVHWLAGCLDQGERKLSLSTSCGLFSGGRQLTPADASQPEFARIALRDPDADHILLETALSGILRGGLGYRLADLAIILNFVPAALKSAEVRLDHPEDQAYAQSVVAEQVRPDGVAILNADQHLVSEVRPRLQCPALWFSRDELNRTVRSSLRRDERAVILKGGMVVLASGKRPELTLFDIGGFLPSDADWWVDVVLAVTAALIALEVPTDEIATLLARSKPAFPPVAAMAEDA